jgi:hypothetical protein
MLDPLGLQQAAEHLTLLHTGRSHEAGPATFIHPLDLSNNGTPLVLLEAEHNVRVVGTL